MDKQRILSEHGEPDQVALVADEEDTTVNNVHKGGHWCCHKQVVSTSFEPLWAGRKLSGKKCLHQTSELTAHLAMPVNEICGLVTVAPSPDPEDGVTATAEAILTTRIAPQKITDWDQLWHLLFPEDTEVPSFSE
jgi:hypothetical protein